jgi:hypothetical protein
MEMYVVWAALFTAILYYFDYRKYHDTTYFSNHSFLAWKTPLGTFVLIYLAWGLIFALAYYYGIDIGLQKPLPELIESVFRDDIKPAPYIKQIIAGYIIATTARIFASSKTIPGYDGTVDMGVKFLLRKEHEEDNIEDIIFKGKENFIRGLLSTYKKRTGTDMTIDELVFRLTRYLKKTNTYDKPENVPLLQGIQKAMDVEIAFFTLANAGFGKKRLRYLVE